MPQSTQNHKPETVFVHGNTYDDSDVSDLIYMCLCILHICICIVYKCECCVYICVNMYSVCVCVWVCMHIHEEHILDKKATN